VIQPGQVLDKYELMECVGQGGMASVYRAHDLQLKRVVAVKILHRHLSDHREARSRFEREAQAVAKVRHENILEIYDYSAKAGSDSYIVTEFVNGRTLKQCITERAIKFPEIGAMVIVQVCRALAHAHRAAILHRDVKPENIMIRSDGVVKLMDFGIAHIVDLERLTVTGQLLGSPAYMAPEHVQGRPLDFRTDVFAVGIVLYQLAVGRLPFEGKNPHEVLKRIAECQFRDPRQEVGTRLGRIICTAMAAAPDDRYQTVFDMMKALEGYLADAGLLPETIPAELARYLATPEAYESELKARLIEALTRAGHAQLARDLRAAALDTFDRVLSMDPDNAAVREILHRMNRRSRAKSIALATLGTAILGLSGYAIERRTEEPPALAPRIDVRMSAWLPQQATRVVNEGPPPEHARAATVSPARTSSDPAAAPPPKGTSFGAAAESPRPPVSVEVSVAVLGSEFRLDGETTWTPVQGKTFSVSVIDRAVVEIRNPYCPSVKAALDRTSPRVDVPQPFSPASVIARCPIADVSVSIDGASFTLDSPKSIEFDKNALSKDREIVVVFTGSRAIDKQRISVTAGRSVEVTCALH
jgi:serine/threonine-protein kinase